MKLGAWRKKHNLTQAQLAVLMKTNQAHVSELEAGIHSPSIATLTLLSTITDGQVGWLDWAKVVSTPKSKAKAKKEKSK